MDNYLAVLFTTNSMTSGTTADIFTVFLNKHAKAGYAFRYAIQVRDGEYMMIFEKVVM